MLINFIFIHCIATNTAALQQTEQCLTWMYVCVCVYVCPDSIQLSNWLEYTCNRVAVTIHTVTYNPYVNWLNSLFAMAASSWSSPITNCVDTCTHAHNFIINEWVGESIECYSYMKWERMRVLMGKWTHIDLDWEKVNHKKRRWVHRNESIR